MGTSKKEDFEECPVRHGEPRKMLQIDKRKGFILTACVHLGPAGIPGHGGMDACP